MREYWNDVGSLSELRQGTFDALRGELRRLQDEHRRALDEAHRSHRREIVPLNQAPMLFRGLRRR